MPAPVGDDARDPYAMKRVPSLDVRCRSRSLADPPAIGAIGGRESDSTHMAVPPWSGYSLSQTVSSMLLR